VVDEDGVLPQHEHVGDGGLELVHAPLLERTRAKIDAFQDAARWWPQDTNFYAARQFRHLTLRV